MRKYGILLVVALMALVALTGCFPPPTLTVTLESPANGSTVDSLAPILAWTCSESGAEFRIQVASDGNFQNLITDVSNLGAPSYSVPSGKLTNDQSYYWRVNATKGGQTSDWSTYWSFKTPAAPATGTIYVNATLDGSSWSGVVYYTITGPQQNSGSSVPATFSNLSAGTYTLSYSSGTPPGATFTGTTPSPTQTLSTSGTITFTLNFATVAASSIVVSATLDGSPWSGGVKYSIYGPSQDSHNSVPYTFSNLPAGTYTLSYTSGGPSGAQFANISPSPTQTLASRGTIYFTINFYTVATGTAYIDATLDDSAWSGPVSYTMHGPKTDSSYSVPDSFSGLPAGTYSLHYISGGPSGAQFVGVTPPSQSLHEGGSISFTIQFSTQATGTIYVSATLDGSPWQTAIGSGPISYTIHGPRTDSSSTVPDSFSDMPPGTYTLQRNSGGPIGAQFVGISPAPTRTLSPNGSISFTMNFQSEATGTVYVDATYNGERWPGPVRYTLAGPYVDSHGSVPYTFTNCPSGSYTLQWTSGGPEGAYLRSIDPAQTQPLSAGGSISFTMNFLAGLVEGEGPPVVE
jgi:uncharacterized protein (DUF2141 family)